MRRHTCQKFSMNLECGCSVCCALLHSGQRQSDLSHGVEVGCASWHGRAYPQEDHSPNSNYSFAYSASALAPTCDSVPSCHHGHRSDGRFTPASRPGATLPLSPCRKRGSPLIDGKHRRGTRKQVRHQLRMQTYLGVSTCIGKNGHAVVFIRRLRQPTQYKLCISSFRRERAAHSIPTISLIGPHPLVASFLKRSQEHADSASCSLSIGLCECQQPHQFADLDALQRTHRIFDFLA